MNNGVGRAPLAALGEPRRAGHRRHRRRHVRGGPRRRTSAGARRTSARRMTGRSTGWPRARASPARRFDEPLLGRIEPGAPADLVVLDYAGADAARRRLAGRHWIFGLVGGVGPRRARRRASSSVRDRRRRGVDDGCRSRRATRDAAAALWDRLEAVDEHPFEPTGGPVDGRPERRGLRPPLPQPVLPAAGPPVRDGAAIAALRRGRRRRPGRQDHLACAPRRRRRRTWPRSPHGMVNTELWSELPPEQWLEHEYALARTAGLPLIVSLGYTAEEIAELAPRVRPFADAVELSTHYIGEDPGPMVGAIRAAKAALDVPVFVKLSPHGRDMAGRRGWPQAPARTASSPSTRSGRSCRSTSRRAMPRLGGSDGYGWLSGPALKPLAVRCVRDIARAVDDPGHRRRRRHARDRRGRDAAWPARRPCRCARRRSCAARRLRQDRRASSTRGSTSTATHPSADMRRPRDRRAGRRRSAGRRRRRRPCNGCGMCETSCVRRHPRRRQPRSSPSTQCARCGLCVTRCRRGAIEWVPEASPA